MNKVFADLKKFALDVLRFATSDPILSVTALTALFLAIFSTVVCQQGFLYWLLYPAFCPLR